MSVRVPLVRVTVSEKARRRVDEVLDSGRLAQGVVVAELEEAFAAASGTRHCVAVTNGTIALQVSLQALGVGPGAEVITTPFTFIATVNSVLAVGARVRFADITDDYTIDPAAVAAVVGEATRCVIPVHLFGLPADTEAIATGLKGRDIAILEDAAQAHGAGLGDRHVGGLGTLGCFSLYATKNLSAGEGGLITTDNDEVAAKLRVLRNQGMRARYDYAGWGSNYRMSDLHAAVVVDDVYRLEEINSIRQRNAERLLVGLDGIPGLLLPMVPGGRRSVWHQFTVRVTSAATVSRDDLIAGLGRRGIGSDVFYPAALTDVPHLAEHPDVADDAVPNARTIAQEVVSLPVGHHLNDSEIDLVVNAVREVLHA